MQAEPEVTAIRRVSFEAPHPAGGVRPYVLEVAVTGPLDSSGYVVDFFELERLLKAAVSTLDFPRPAERLAVACWRELEPRLAPPARLTRVVLWETPNQGAEYHGQ